MVGVDELVSKVVFVRDNYQGAHDYCTNPVADINVNSLPADHPFKVEFDELVSTYTTGISDIDAGLVNWTTQTEAQLTTVLTNVHTNDAALYNELAAKLSRLALSLDIPELDFYFSICNSAYAARNDIRGPGDTSMSIQGTNEIVSNLIINMYGNSYSSTEELPIESAFNNAKHGMIAAGKSVVNEAEIVALLNVIKECPNVAFPMGFTYVDADDLYSTIGALALKTFCKFSAGLWNIYLKTLPMIESHIAFMDVLYTASRHGSLEEKVTYLHAQINLIPVDNELKSVIVEEFLSAILNNAFSSLETQSLATLKYLARRVADTTQRNAIVSELLLRIPTYTDIEDLLQVYRAFYQNPTDLIMTALVQNQHANRDIVEQVAITTTNSDILTLAIDHTNCDDVTRLAIFNRTFSTMPVLTPANLVSIATSTNSSTILGLVRDHPNGNNNLAVLNAIFSNAQINQPENAVLKNTVLRLRTAEVVRNPDPDLAASMDNFRAYVIPYATNVLHNAAVDTAILYNPVAVATPADLAIIAAGTVSNRLGTGATTPPIVPAPVPAVIPVVPVAVATIPVAAPIIPVPAALTPAQQQEAERRARNSRRALRK